VDPKFPKPEEEYTKEDLREVLINFWLATVRGEHDAEFPEKLKASEYLAKFILGSGRTSVPKGPVGKPSTQDILRMVEMFEGEDESS